MKKTQIRKEMQTISEEEFLPGSIHLWQGVRQALVAKRLLLINQGETKMNKRNRITSTISWTAGACVTLILLGIVIFVTPQGKVLAQEIVNFFTRGDSNQQTVNQMQACLEPQPTELAATPLAVNPKLDEGCGSPLLPRCTLDEVQKSTPFMIQALGTLPGGMAFNGATSIPNGVLLQYSGVFGTITLIESSIVSNPNDTWTVGKDAVIQSTKVHQYPAEYVEGSWSGLNGMKEDVLVWDESIPSRTLRWQAGDINFTLINNPQRGVNGPIGYDMEQLKTMAEEVQTDSDTSITTLTDDGISLDEAEIKAGFVFKKTNQIPAGLALYKTTYDSERNTICQYFRGYKEDPQFPALVIAQSTLPMPSLEGFQTEINSAGSNGEFELVEEVININNTDGEEATLFETSVQVDAFCGGVPSIVGRALLWQQQDRSFAILARQDYGDGISFVSKLEMQRIAQSINGKVVTEDPSKLDPERLLSLKDAEKIIGMEILEPAVMLSTFQFDHVFAGKVAGWPYAIVTEYKDISDSLDGERSRILVYQIPQSDQTLELRRLGGGYSNATVRGVSAIYSTFCTDSEPYGTNCNHEIVWFEGDTQYYIEVHAPFQVPSETLIAIADSMH